MRTIKEIKEDYNLFVDIQINKYLKTVDKKEFSDEQEATSVLRRIFYTYNVDISDEHLKLTNLKREAKEKWFESIEIDFDQNVSDENSKLEDITNDDLEKATEFFYERFPFLPDGSIVALLFVGPALEAYGLPAERFYTLMRGEDECTEMEEDLLIWAFELTLTVMESVFEKSKNRREKAFKEALSIAMEEFDEANALEVIEEIASIIKEFEIEFDSKNPKDKKKK
ncbi:MAG: hypothetical protein K6T54_14405 [Ignavibacterium sp.]|nr:hypothetical protein [Ignavibacterium sp.]